MGLLTFARNTTQTLRHLWSFRPEARSYSYSEVVNQAKGLLDSLTGFNSSNEPVNEETAMRVAAVFYCVNLRSNALAMLPGNVLRYVKGRTEVAVDHPAQRLLHLRPNPWQTPLQFWKYIVQLIDLEGEAFVLILRKPNTDPVELRCVHNEDMQVYIDANQQPYYVWKGTHIPYTNVLHFKMYSKDGKRGHSIISQNSETIGASIKQRKYSNRSLQTMPPAYGSTKEMVMLKGESKKQLQEYLNNEMADWYAHGKFPFLPNGFELKSLGINPKDVAYLDQTKATKEDIHGIFGIPDGIISGQGKYNSLELQALHLLLFTMQPIITNIEQEVTEKLFVGSERNTHYFKFNEKALLRTDAKTQAELIQLYLKNGVYNRNEAREILDLNAVEYGDQYFIEGNNMVPIKNLMEAEPAEPAALTDEDLRKALNGHKRNGHAAHAN